MAEIDSQLFRSTMGQFCTGVVVASACLEGEAVGFAAQSFVSLSMDPPLVALCPAKTSTSWPKIRDSGSFCINILAADQKAVCDAMRGFFGGARSLAAHEACATTLTKVGGAKGGDGAGGDLVEQLQWRERLWGA